MGIQNIYKNLMLLEDYLTQRYGGVHFTYMYTSHGILCIILTLVTPLCRYGIKTNSASRKLSFKYSFVTKTLYQLNRIMLICIQKFHVVHT